MKYLKDDAALLDMDSSEDTQESLVLREERLTGIDQQLRELAADSAPVRRAALLLESGRALIDLERFQEAWERAREAFDIYTAAEDWEGAVQACEILFLSDQSESLPALGQGIWLAVTFPVDPELTVAMLQHVIDDTPPDSDGAAVAAIVAHYVVDLRATEGKSRENLLFYTNQMLATVARRHSGVKNQQDFDKWFQKLELNDPALFLPRLRNVVDVLVQDEWWIDRDALREKLPVN
jgi:hypothetical protein